MKEAVRKSVIAGTWYPGNPDVLRNEIEGFFKKVPATETGGTVVGVIAPHAGYVYSGEVAAHAYKLLKGDKFDSVIVIGPSHRAYFHGASVCNKGGFETPLGIVPVDADLAEGIISGGRRLSYIPAGHAQEHSVEIQLPFLQVALGAFKFVPIVMGDQGRQACVELAEAIARAVQGRKTLLVGSSDLSHYHDDDRARKLDSRILKCLESMDAETLLNDLESGSSEACGGGPMAVTMMAARRLGAGGSKLLKYANSGDITGDRNGVVGYASAVFYKRAPDKADKKDQAGEAAGLLEEEKKHLLASARRTIQGRLTGEKASPPEPESAVLQEKRGAFVSLHTRSGRLRGCIGCIEGRWPLAKTIREMALSAAFNDPRFPPLSLDELKNLDIEISVLTPLKEIRDIEEIEVGKHGIYLTKGFYSGLLLPQVATQYGWDRLTFLSETCRKAGLPSQAWKDKDTRIYIFSADIFGEKE